MEKKICGIYCIENLTNGKKYIGQSVDIKHRFYEHKSDLNANSHYNSHLQSAWNSYGKENFDFYIIEECSPDMLDEREKYYIKLFSVNIPEFGYNNNAGGKGIVQESREKLSNAAKKVVWDEDKKKQLSIRMSGENNPFYGKKHTKENIDKMKKNRKDTSGKNNPMYGKHHTKEAKEKMSQEKKGVLLSDEHKAKLRGRTAEKNSRHKPVYCPELNRVFWGPTQVEQEGITKQSYISAVLIGNQKTAGKHSETGEPLHWVYANEYNGDVSL